MSRFYFSFLMLLSLLQVSCALSPQQITIKPKIIVPVASYGRGQEINIRVEDKRVNNVIGMRGGVYGDTSTIEISNDHKIEMAYAVANGLTRWGFKTQVNGEQSRSEKMEISQFVLTLNTLSYLPDSNPAVGKVHITASVSIDVKQGGRSYRGTYEANGDMGYVTVPSESRNNKQINLVLNLALQKIFDDQALIKFLQ